MEKKGVVEEMNDKFHEFWSFGINTNPLIPLMSSSSRVDRELVREILIRDSFFTRLKVCTVLFLREVSRQTQPRQTGSGRQVQGFQCLPSPVSRPSLLKLSTVIEV